MTALLAAIERLSDSHCLGRDSKPRAGVTVQQTVTGMTFVRGGGMFGIGGGGEVGASGQGVSERQAGRQAGRKADRTRKGKKEKNGKRKTMNSR